RAVVDDLVAELPNRPLRPRPTGEARHHRTTGSGQLRDTPHVRGRVGDVVEVAEREHNVVGPGKIDLDEVALNQGHLVAEAREPGAGEVEHRVGQVDVHVLRGALLEQKLPDAGRAAAHVEDARRLVLACYLARELAAVEETGTEGALEGVLL